MVQYTLGRPQHGMHMVAGQYCSGICEDITVTTTILPCMDAGARDHIQGGRKYRGAV